MSQTRILFCILCVALVVCGATAMGQGQEVKPLILVINYPYQIWASDPSKIHLCLFKPDFTPAVGAEVKIGEEVVGKADEHGACIFAYQPGNATYHTLTATLEEKGAVYRVIKQFQCNSRTASFRSEQIYVYTDRGVYNPGQDILIRCIAWKLAGAYSPIKDARVQLLFQDRQGSVFSGGWITTNEYGVGAFKIPLPPNMEEGDYELVVLYEKARESTPVRVQRFVPPVIRIEHSLPRFLTQAQNELTVEVNLSYFAGGSLKGSSLALKALDEGKKELYRKDISSLDPQRYRFTLGKQELNLIRTSLTLERPFHIVLLATDGYGRTSEVIRDMIYTGRPYRAVLELDKDSYQMGEKVQILAKVNDLDGRPARGIPLYLNINALHLSLEAQSDEKGVAVFMFEMGNTSVSVELLSPIVAYPLASRQVVFSPKKPMVSKVETPPVRQEIETEIVAIFDPEYMPVEKVVHVDLTDISGALVTATTIPIVLDDGRYVARGRITAPTWGTMLVNLYCCAVKKENTGKPYSIYTVGFITEGQHVTLHPASRLKISFLDLKPTARPGEEYAFEVKVISQDADESCVGVAMVDDAVISLLDPLEKTPQDRFYNPQLKTIASGGAAVLTWPVVDRNWGYPWRDIAYCDWGWKAPQPEGETPPTDISYGPAGTTEPMAPTPAPSVTSPTVESMEEQKCLVDKAGEDGSMLPCPYAVPEAGNGGKAKNGPKREEGGKLKPMITIRKNFPETALWEPLLVTKNGSCRCRVIIPDAITVQNISVVASDVKGGIELERRKVEVHQDVFVRSGLPAAATLNDVLSVQALVSNFSEEEQKFRVTLTSPDFAVLSPPAVEVEVAKDEGCPVSWEIQALRCGTNVFTIEACGENYSDSETRTLFVRPEGEPQITLVRQSLTNDHPALAEFTIHGDTTYHTAFLNISFPNVFPALQGLEALATFPHGCAEQTASSVLTNIAVLEWAQKNRLPSEKIEVLQFTLLYGAARLIAMQNPDGGWGWFDNTSSNVYLTGYVLRALGELKRCDVPVSEKTLSSGIEFLLKTRNEKGLWSSGRVFFWAPVVEESDVALTAELFSVLVAVARDLPQGDRYYPDLLPLKALMVEYLRGEPQEPLAVANAISGLTIWFQWRKDEAIKHLLECSLEYLITLKRKGYWEPHWYHAYGGMVEVNARILELMAMLEPVRYEGYLREGVTWLMATRESWGGWHNTMGTAAAVRALLKATSDYEEVPSTVSIEVNGHTVTTVNIEPADPFLSAASLRHLELTPYLKQGTNNVCVAYTGRLTASLMLDVRQWGLTPDENRGLSIQRIAPSHIALGAPVEIALEISAPRPLPFVMVEERVPANMAIAEHSLIALKQKGEISDYKIAGDTVFFYLERVENTVRFSYTLDAVRPGKAGHAGVLASAMYEPNIRASAVGGEIEVK